MAHESLIDYYKLNFSMMQHFHYSLAELEDMVPFEREIYISLLTKHIEEEKTRLAQQNR